jgi:signal peptidase I
MTDPESPTPSSGDARTADLGPTHAAASETARTNAKNRSASAPEGEQTSTLRWLVETAILVGLAFLLAQGIKTFVVQPYIIPTGSMIPTIELQDRVLAEKITYRFRSPRQGEIVVFNDPTGQHPKLIKRVIAVGGQTVDVHDGKVWVDGKALDEPYVHGKVTEPGTVPLPITIPAGDVWLMGDNRPNSGDSRFFGPQPVSSVDGRAFFTYWPPSRIGALR